MRLARVMAALLLLLLTAIPARGQVRQSDQTVDRDAFAKAWIDAWDSHDIDRILTYYTDDAFYEDVPSVENGWGVPARGHMTGHFTLPDVPPGTYTVGAWHSFLGVQEQQVGIAAGGTVDLGFEFDPE